MSNAFIQALLMDDPDVGGGGGGSWPDPPGAGEPAAPAVIPPGEAYGCISPEIGNKAAYTAATVGEGYTGNKNIFSDAVTPYGDGILIGPSTVATSSAMWKTTNAGHCTYVSFKFMVPSFTPIDDCGNLYAGTGHLGAGILISVVFGREAVYDAWRRPYLQVRSRTTDAFTTVNIGAGPPTAGQWYTFYFQIAAGIATYSIRTSDTDILWASGTLAGSTWTAMALDTFSLWNDADVDTGSAYVAALRFCGTASIPVPGTEALTGIGMSTNIGDLNSPAGFRRLSGQAIATAAGSVSVFNANRTVALVGQNLTASKGSVSVLPYPDLLSGTIDLNPIPTWGALEVTFQNDGTYLIEQVTYAYVGKVTYTGRWLEDSEIDETDIAHQYRCAALANYGDGTPTLDTVVPGALGRVSVAFVVPPTFTQYVEFSISVVPRVNNPRYGEIGYIGTFRISIPMYFSLPP